MTFKILQKISSKSKLLHNSQSLSEDIMKPNVRKRVNELLEIYVFCAWHKPKGVWANRETGNKAPHGISKFLDSQIPEKERTHGICDNCIRNKEYMKIEWKCDK